MAKLNRDWRRRWVLALLFILLMTASMMGPTQALSGVKTASVAVMEAFAAMVGPDTPTSQPAASAPGASTALWIDEALNDFTKLFFGAESPSGEVGSVASAAAGSPTAAIGDAGSSATTQHQAGGFGASGRPAYQGGAGSGLGLGTEGAAGAPVEALAATDQGLAQELAVFDISSGSPTFAFDPGAADDESVFLPGGPDSSVPGASPGGSGPGGPVGSGPPESAASGPTGPEESGLNDHPVLQAPAPEPEGPVLTSTPYADGTVPPFVINDLLDDLDVPSPDLPGAAPNAAPGRLDLSQIPEPSTLVLTSLGLAALRYRSRQGNCRRHS